MNVTPTPEAVHRESVVEAFRQIVNHIEAGDVPPLAPHRSIRVFLTVEGLTPGEYAVAALALDASMEIVQGEAWASRDFGGVTLTLCAPVEQVTTERAVVTPERVFAEPPAPLSLLPDRQRGSYRVKDTEAGFTVVSPAGERVGPWCSREDDALQVASKLNRARLDSTEEESAA